jgi:CrcB protein
MRSYLPIILIALGGALGSLARYGLGGLVQGNRLNFPAGTLAVNLLGCLVMGFLGWWIHAGLAKPPLRLFLGIGFLGAFTTFSTFSLETMSLFREHSSGAALLYLSASVLGCLLAFAVGYLIASAIWR